MDKRASIAAILADLDDITPGGFAFGAHLQFSGPAFLFQTFPHAWVTTYREEGLQLRDPAVFWGYHNTGFIRWHELAHEDPGNVMGRAAEHGLPYGATVALSDGGTKSMVGFGRADRDYLDAEIAEIQDCARRLHRATQGLSVLSQDDIDALKRMSVQLSLA